jgi:hypothetical protein
MASNRSNYVVSGTHHSFTALEECSAISAPNFACLLLGLGDRPLLAEFCPLRKSAIDPGGLNKTDRESSLGEETTSKNRSATQIQVIESSGVQPLKNQ